MYIDGKKRNAHEVRRTTINKKVISVEKTFYGTSGLVSARQIVDVTGYHVLYPDNSSSKTMKSVRIEPKPAHPSFDQE